MMGNEMGNLPVRNWSDGFFENTEAITATAVQEKLGGKMEGCTACNIKCKKAVSLDGKYNVDPRNGGPEYETLGSLGSLCGVDDLEAICKANELCNLYSLDTISAGSTVSFAMECFEKGILTTEDTGGLDLSFGNAEAMVKLIEMIAKREGIGDLLAEGTKAAAEKIGKGADAYAIHAKGLDFPMHEPRLKQGLGLTYAIEAHGADHCAGLHDTMIADEGKGIDDFRSFGHYEPLPIDDLSARKVAILKTQHIGRHFFDTIGCCSMPPWSIQNLADIVSAITGWSYTTTEALKAGERAVTLNRVYNYREGFTSKDDKLPDRFFSPTPRGGLKDTALDRDAFEKATHTWYYLFGWDKETGKPTEETLDALSVGWAAEYL